MARGYLGGILRCQSQVNEIKCQGELGNLGPTVNCSAPLASLYTGWAAKLSQTVEAASKRKGPLRVEPGVAEPCTQKFLHISRTHLHQLAVPRKVIFLF